MLKKSHLIFLLVLVVLALALLKLPGETMGKFKLAVSGLFLPLFGLTGSAHELLGEAREGLTPKRELQRQIDQLQRQAQEQQLLLSQDAAVWAENARLRALVGWPRQTRWKLKLARVISRDPANWWRSLEIDLGARDGLRTNCPVLTAAGLVGRVQGVGQTRSQVVMLGDPNLRVSAVVTNNGEVGVLFANSSMPQEDGMIDLDYLRETASWRRGRVSRLRATAVSFHGASRLGELSMCAPRITGCRRKRASSCRSTWGRWRK